MRNIKIIMLAMTIMTVSVLSLSAQCIGVYMGDKSLSKDVVMLLVSEYESGNRIIKIEDMSHPPLAISRIYMICNSWGDGEKGGLCLKNENDREEDVSVKLPFPVLLRNCYRRNITDIVLSSQQARNAKKAASRFGIPVRIFTFEPEQEEFNDIRQRRVDMSAVTGLALQEHRFPDEGFPYGKEDESMRYHDPQLEEEKRLPHRSGDVIPTSVNPYTEMPINDTESCYNEGTGRLMDSRTLTITLDLGPDFQEIYGKERKTAGIK